MVELEGIEPSSKQGRPVLSTRLSQPSVFECRQDLGHQPAPYPLNLIRNARPSRNISDFAVPLNQGASEQQPLSDIPSRHLVPGLSQIAYYASTRQRERNCFRQINCRQSLIIESGCQLSACLHNTSSCCQIHVSPGCARKNRCANIDIFSEPSKRSFLFFHRVCINMHIGIKILVCSKKNGFLCNKLMMF